MGAAPAYSYYPDGAAQRAPERAPERRPRIDVVPGGRTSPQPQAASPAVPKAAAAAVVAMLMVFGLAVGRVALSAATIEAAEEGTAIASEIDDARAAGTTLEVSASVLSSPSNLKTAATALGMSESTGTVVVSLAEDVVACDEAGNLSLSLSVAQAADLEG